MFEEYQEKYAEACVAYRERRWGDAMNHLHRAIDILESVRDSRFTAAMRNSRIQCKDFLALCRNPHDRETMLQRQEGLI